MTEKLFDLDSYCTRFSASVLSCEPASKNGMQGFAVKLDRTCFFPEGGGQPADTGCLQAGDQSAQVLYTYEQEESDSCICATSRSRLAARWRASLTLSAALPICRSTAASTSCPV